MGMFKNSEDKTQDMMNNPETKSKIEQIAREKGISLESAKEHYMKLGDK